MLDNEFILKIGQCFYLMLTYYAALLCDLKLNNLTSVSHYSAKGKILFSSSLKIINYLPLFTCKLYNFCQPIRFQAFFFFFPLTSLAAIFKQMMNSERGFFRKVKLSILSNMITQIIVVVHQDTFFFKKVMTQKACCV